MERFRPVSCISSRSDFGTGLDKRSVRISHSKVLSETVTLVTTWFLRSDIKRLPEGF